MKSLGRTTLWTGSSTLIKVFIGLLVVKLLAYYFGPEGVGRAANYMTLLTIIGVLSGAGIFNGITKYVSQYENDVTLTRELLGNASSIILLFSTLLAFTLLIFSQSISQLLFVETNYAFVIRMLAISQFMIALSNYFLAILRGKRDAKRNAVSLIIGSLLGLLAFIVALYLFDYQGALIGLALIPAFVVLPAFVSIKQISAETKNSLSLSQLKPLFNRGISLKLLKYSLMVLATTVTLPVAYIIMRDWLIHDYSVSEVGLWQGVSKISDAYLQFLTTGFAVYLLPTFAKLEGSNEIRKEITKSLLFVIPAAIVLSIIIYVMRELIIVIVFSEQFYGMKPLFLWQLLGDIFKVSAFVFGYFVVAKASLRFYILAEISQFILLLASSYFLIPIHGAVGATQAYLFTYVIYFILCVSVFFFYIKSLQKKERSKQKI